jgi:hypothetical protein
LTPAGRHPSGAHDGGVNFDITYFMRRPVDTYVVCPATSDNHCVGPALDLDADRQAYFFATLGRLHHNMDDGLILCMAVDGWVKRALMPAFARLQMHGDFTPAVINETEQLVYGEMTDQGTGWYRFHHNHTHLRFLPRADDPARLSNAPDATFGGLLNRPALANQPRPAAVVLPGPQSVATAPSAPQTVAPVAPVAPTPAPQRAAAAPAPRVRVKPAPVMEAPTDSFLLVLPYRHGAGARAVPAIR